MADITENTEVNINSHVDTFSLGEKLRCAREDKKMSVEQVCASLRIGQRQVIALETNDFSVLPDAMITRGFIRNYARLLGVDAEPLLESYKAYQPTNSVRSITIPSANIEMTQYQKRQWLPYIIASGVMIVLLAAWYIYMELIPKHTIDINRLTNSISSQVASVQPSISSIQSRQELTAQVAPSSQSTVVEEPLPEPALPQAERMESNDVGLNEVSVLSQTDQNQMASPTKTLDVQPSVEQGVVTSSPIEGGQSKLSITTKASSWINVVDKNDKLIFDQVLPAGTQQVIEVKPPFKLVVGNAPETQISYNNHNVDLAPYTKVRVARLTLE